MPGSRAGVEACTRGGACGAAGLWQRAGTRGDGLTEMAWIKQLLNVLGKEDAEQLCEVVFEQYRGDENPAKRQWSGLRSHVTAMAKEKERGVEPARY